MEILLNKKANNENFTRSSALEKLVITSNEKKNHYRNTIEKTFNLQSNI